MVEPLEFHMNRRQLLQAGVLGTGGVMIGQAVGEELEFSRDGSQTESQGSNLPYRAGENLKIDTHLILDNEINPTASGIEDWGDIGRGTHIREFNIPPNTHLILGQVQEAGHYGAAIYETLGIAINTSIWRCRVIWRMDWYLPMTLRTYFNWQRFESPLAQAEKQPDDLPRE